MINREQNKRIDAFIRKSEEGTLFQTKKALETAIGKYSEKISCGIILQTVFDKIAGYEVGPVDKDHMLKTVLREYPAAAEAINAYEQEQSQKAPNTQMTLAA